MAPNPATPAAAPAGWVRDDRYSVVLTAMICTLTVLMIVPEGFNYESLGTAAAPQAGSPLSRLLWLALLGGGLLVLLWRASVAWLLLRFVNPFLLLFMVLAAASVVWSIEPSVTVRRLVRLLTILLVCTAYVLAGWHRHRFQDVMRPLLTGVLLASIVFGIVNPTLAIHQETSAELVGAWRGIANHKNTLGALSSIGLILWFHAWLLKEVRPWPALWGGATAATCLLLSRSSTSLMTSVFVILFLLLLLRGPIGLRRYMPLFTTLFVLGLLTYAVAVLRLVPGADLLLKPVVWLTGKDMSFTGRSEIWEIIVEHIKLNPLLGSGYGAYWTGPRWGTPSFVFEQKMYFYPGSAHNGYLEICNDLGAVGLLCLAGYMLAHVAGSVQLWHHDRGQAALYLGLFFQQGISNLSETHWLSVLNVDVVIITLASMALARGLLELRLRSFFGDPAATRPPVAPMAGALR